MNKQLFKNIKNKTVKKCLMNPLTGYNRDGYCRTDSFDNGSHLVCAKMDESFMNYTASKGNNLSSVVKPGDQWCINIDKNGCYNIKKLFYSYITTGIIPEVYRREFKIE